MNWKKFILLSCVVQCVFAVSTATAQMRGHRASTARMPMHRAPMLNSASGFQRRRSGDFDRDDRFRRFNRFNRFVFIDTFGFPFFYPYPYYGYYPYNYYGYNDLETQLWRCKADSLALGTTMDPSMGSWDLKRDEQFALTNATTISARTA